jgi:hypothetical protein
MSSFTLMRLSQAPDLDALRRVWESLSPEQRADPYIVAYKDHYKRLLSGVKA